MRAIPLFTLVTLFLAAVAAPGADPKGAKVLIITGDEYHKWKETAPFLKKLLTKAGLVVDITETPSKDLTPENLAKYDAFVLNYRDTAKGAKENPASVWSDANKKAFLDAVKGGKGLYVYHYASASFTNPSAINKEFEKAIAGGWRKQGFHGPAHAFKVKKTDVKHPVSEGLPSEFDHAIDELYQNSLLTPGSAVLATAFSDPAKPKGTGKDEAVIWVNHYGKGRVFECALGHDTAAMADPNFQKWMRRGVEWAATGNVSQEGSK
jgi:type 1 glutamine amidotransferase